VPIALLPELTAALSRAARALHPWSRLAEIDERLLRRAKSAFLVHWFGTGVPEKQLSLHVAIGNMAALQERYLLVKRSMPGAPPELNLLGPLSGIAGLLVGFALSPTGLILVATQIDEITTALGLGGGAGTGVLAMLLLVLTSMVLPILGPGLFLYGGLAAVAGNERTTRAIYLLLGELAMLLDATVRLWDVITGPRSEVRNPLLRRILDLLDRFAGLFVQVIGCVAFFIVRVARLLPWLADQFRALGSLLGSVWEALQDIFHDFLPTLLDPFSGRRSPLAIIETVLDTISALPALMLQSITELVEDATTDVIAAFGAITTAIEGFVGGLTERIGDAFAETALGQLLQRIETLLEMMPAVIEAFRAGPGPKKKEEEEESPVLDFFLFGITDGLLGGIGPIRGSVPDLVESLGTLPVPGFPEIEVPEFPSPPTTADLEEIMRRIGEPAGLDTEALTERLRDEAEAAELGVDSSILADPASAFAQDRAALEALGRPELRRGGADLLPGLLLGDERLRDLIYLALGRVLPGALRVHAPQVRELFDAFDERVYGLEPEAPPEHPMLDMGDSGRLRPVVGLLRIVSPGGFAPDLRAFRDVLVEQLEGLTYLADPAPLAPGGG
jgi:hypothetical protein